MNPTDTPRPLLNAETLAGNKPLGLPMPEPITVRPQLPDVERIRANCAEQIRRLDELTRPVSTADVASLARELGEHYAGGDDGPIREPGDDMPKASDVFTPDEAVAALNTHAALCAKRGMYGTATDLGLAADIIDHQQEQIEEARDVVRMLVDRLEAAGLGSCTKDVRCLLGDHAGACVFSVAERDQVRRDDREADDHDGE